MEWRSIKGSQGGLLTNSTKNLQYRTNTSGPPLKHHRKRPAYDNCMECDAGGPRAFRPRFFCPPANGAPLATF